MTYAKQRMAAMPTSSAQVRERLSTLGSDFALVLSSHDVVLRDHALAIDEIRDAQEDLRAFIDWVNGTYPDIITQYKAIKDIQESANAQPTT